MERREKAQAEVISQQVGGVGACGGSGWRCTLAGCMLISVWHSTSRLLCDPPAHLCSEPCSPPCPLPTITPHPLPCPLQAKRLEELDSLYRDEAIMRKKIFNQMEDMKGKIRVYCRIRPILQMERDRGQTGGGWVGGSVLAVRVAVSVGRGRGGGGSLAPPLPAPHARCFSGPCLAARMLQPPALLCLPPCPHHPLQRRSRSPTSSPAR